MQCIGDVGQRIVDIGVEKMRKLGVIEIEQFPGFPSVDKFPYESYVKIRRNSKRCIIRSINVLFSK
jgi:hypothetical protein